MPSQSSATYSIYSTYSTVTLPFRSIHIYWVANPNKFHYQYLIWLKKKKRKFNLEDELFRVPHLFVFCVLYKLFFWFIKEPGLWEGKEQPQCNTKGSGIHLFFLLSGLWVFWWFMSSVFVLSGGQKKTYPTPTWRDDRIHKSNSILCPLLLKHATSTIPWIFYHLQQSTATAFLHLRKQEVDFCFW